MVRFSKDAASGWRAAGETEPTRYHRFGAEGMPCASQLGE